jgi:hypothetical protein
MSHERNRNNRKTPDHRGFDYHVSDEQIAEYRKKPPELRLAWLYQAAVLRMHYPRDVLERQERFRRG